MWLRLASLWGCTLTEAMLRCDSKEFALWVAYYRIDPWGESRADLRAGIMASTVANVGVRDSRFKPSDFMPKFDNKIERVNDEPQSEEEMKRQLEAFIGG